MKKFLASSFHIREWSLFSLAIICAITAVYLTDQAGLGAAGALILFTFVGTILFISIGGQHRTFFTALFTGTYIGIGFLWSAFSAAFIEHEPLDSDFWLAFVFAFVFYSLIPVAIAWLITFVIRKLSKSDNHEA